MTQQQDQTFPYYRSPEAIRNEVFSHRVRGLDEAEVREYLELLADQVHAADLERAEYRAENQRLRAEVERLKSRPEPSPDEINPQAVILFSQAQQVADQLVEEAVVHARDLMTSARNQQREILEQAHKAAEAAARQVADGTGRDMVTSAAAPPAGYTQPVPEIEYVRTFARVAQVQLRSVLDALTEQVDKLGEVPDLGPQGRAALPDSSMGRVIAPGSWRVEPLPPQD
ncbi:MAG TPA: DivIVA domain-containing protein [Nocardioidaceae bacterium]|nr:DivIVA domain-containing protein [Nocardioidaceae bacterium]